MVVKQRGGKWGVPKGHLNRCESVFDGALREMMEETGITREQLCQNVCMRARPPFLPPFGGLGGEELMRYVLEVLFINGIHLFVFEVATRLTGTCSIDTQEIEIATWRSVEFLLSNRQVQRHMYNRTITRPLLLHIRRYHVQKNEKNWQSIPSDTKKNGRPRSHPARAESSRQRRSASWRQRATRCNQRQRQSAYKNKSKDKSIHK